MPALQPPRAAAACCAVDLPCSLKPQQDGLLTLVRVRVCASQGPQVGAKSDGVRRMLKMCEQPLPRSISDDDDAPRLGTHSPGDE